MKLSKEEFLRRHQRLFELMERAGAEALVIEGGCRIDQRGWMRYFTDYYVPVFDEFAVLPLGGPVTFFARNTANARIVEKQGIAEQVLCIPADEANTEPGKCVAEFLKAKGLSKVAFCGKTSKLFEDTLAMNLGEWSRSDLTPQLETLRMIKSNEELMLAEEAVQLNELVFQRLLQGIRPGSREMDAVAKASFLAQQMQCEDQFWLIGSGSAPEPCSLPFAVQKEHILKEGELCSVVIEIAGAGGYYGEVTHLVSIGEPSCEIVRAFETISNALCAAASVIRPGKTVGGIADEVNRCLIDAGYRKAPDTGIMGHGQGLDMSEEPMIHCGNQTVLQPGMRLNLHPGLTLSNGIKVTACDCHTVTEDGVKRLSTLPREIIVL